MTDKVTLTHPSVSGSRIAVEARSLPHYARAGWVEAEDPPPEPLRKARRRKPADDPTDD